MSKISITRALTEIKHLGDRINRAASEPFIAIAKGKDEKAVCITSPGKSISEVSTTLKANLQSVQDLIARRDLLKTKVITSNAATTVVINGVSMTVAEAIEKKASYVFQNTLLNNIRQQYAVAKTNIDKANAKLMEEINNAVQQAYGNEKGKVDEDQYKAVANPRLKLSEQSLIDPSDVESLIKKINADIEGFMQEVDFVLSESNSRTEIEV